MKKFLLIGVFLITALACELSEEPLPTLAPTLTPRPSATPDLSPTVPPTVAATPTVALPTATIPPAPTATSTALPNARETGQIRLNDPQRLVWKSDGKALAIINPTILNVFDAVSLSGIASYSAPANATIVEVSLENESLITTVDRKNLDVRRYRSNGAIVRTFRFTTPVGSISFSPDAKSVAVASGEQIAVQLWDIEGNKQIATLKGFQTAAPVYSFSFAPDGKTLIWVSRATVQLMEVESGKLGASVKHEDFVTAATMTKDGGLLATLSAVTVNKQLVGLVKLVEVASGKEVGNLTQKNLATAFAFSPDGKFLAVGVDKAIVLWEVATQKEFLTINGHTDKINSLAFSPDGRVLTSSSKDGTVRLWRLP